MSVTALATGTQTATITTEHTLTTATVAGVFELWVDTINLASGDVLELRIYGHVLTGGTTRVIYFRQYHGAQPTDDLIKISVPIANELAESDALRFTLKQTAGTGRQFPWKVLQLA